MTLFLITNLSKSISKIDLIGIVVGHFIFAIALTQLLDWNWLKNLMPDEDKERMIKNYNWKDLIVDGAILTLFAGLLFVIISIFIWDLEIIVISKNKHKFFDI